MLASIMYIVTSVVSVFAAATFLGSADVSCTEGVLRLCEVGQANESEALLGRSLKDPEVARAMSAPSGLSVTSLPISIL